MQENEKSTEQPSNGSPAAVLVLTQRSDELLKALWNLGELALPLSIAPNSLDTSDLMDLCIRSAAQPGTKMTVWARLLAALA